MEKKLSIGLLLPMSTILPLGKSFELGIKEGLKQLKNEEWEVEIFPEFIGQGQQRKIIEAINKFTSFHDVDLISGIVSNRVIAEIADKVQEQKKPLIINNLGEHFPDYRKFNEYTFLNSPHIWQEVWSLGNWATKQFGKTGMFVSGLYDAGYPFMKMMGDGMTAANPDNRLPFSIAPLKPGTAYSDPIRVFEHIELYKPDFVFSFFCGTEATEFLEEYIRRGYHQKIPLFGLPFLMESFNAPEEEITIYSAINSKVNLEAGLHQQETTNVFNKLGLDTGLIIAEALKTAGQQGLQKALAETYVLRDNEKLSIVAQEAGANHKIYLTKNSYKGDKLAIETHLVEELSTIHANTEAFLNIIDQKDSFWENPYLCV
jgi:branched-chain amino acid transport system substrate-binding protein